MSEDPISKSQIGAGMGRKDVLPKSYGPGSINVSKDYSTLFKTRRSRILFITCCALPHIGICIFVYLEGLKAVSIVLLAVPLVLGVLFWFLQKKLS